MAVIRKVAVANRGEIAKRVIITCHELGLKTVLLYAAGDTHNEAFRLADEQVCIGPADPLKSYLNIEENINGALGSGAEAVHPGYGFLSENPKFARQCEDKNIIFIGPHSETISLFGNKIKAKKLAEKAGVSVLMAGEGDCHDQQLLEKAKELSYPVMLKASCGGGGRGLRLAHDEKELKQLVPLVRSEALQSFNSEEIFLEKYLDSAKHIELQIFVSADQEVYILGDRDCSPQRRHQKIIEEAPSSLSKKMKEQMREASRELCSVLNYKGAGTLEFLVQGDKFYFLEMNTRLQVEHTVTEMIYGVDLVRAQILTAMGQPAFFMDKELNPKGHSIQCRICAEDTSQNFLPSAGTLLFCRWPQGHNIRVDTAYHTGDQISAYYDSLVSKIIVWDDSRVRAIKKMQQSLEQTIIFGIPTNISFLNFLLSHSDFIDNKITITQLEKIQSSEWKEDLFPLPEELAQNIFNELKNLSHRPDSNVPQFNPWSNFLNRHK